MKKLALSLFAVGVLVSHSVQASNEQQRVSGYFDDLKKPAINIADNLWNWAEVGFQEHKSSELLQQTLQDAGFDIQSGVAGMPTAFVASYGDSGPVIGILAEMDALPGLSQDAQPAHSPIAGKQAGHACGHHLFAGGSVTAAMAIKRWLEETGTQGQMKVSPEPTALTKKVYRSDLIFSWQFFGYSAKSNAAVGVYLHTLQLFTVSLITKRVRDRHNR